MEYPLPLFFGIVPPASVPLLRHVRIEGVSLGFPSIVPHLVNVKTLIIQNIGPVFPPPPTSPNGHGTSLHLVEKLQVRQSPGALDFILARSTLPNLVMLSIDDESIPRDRRILGTFPALRSLHIKSEGFHSDDGHASILSSLSSSYLSHLRLFSWPTPEILFSLPATIEFLDVQVGRDLFTLFVWSGPGAFEELADLKTWKTKWLPALRAVRLRDMFSWGESVEERVEALPAEVEDLKVVLDEGAWRQILPKEWCAE